MKKYKAVVFAGDGEWATDYHDRDTIEEVQEALADQGSRWYFYPFHAVILDHGRFTRKQQLLIDVAPPFEEFKGKSINTFANYLRAQDEDFLIAAMEG